MHSAEKHEGQKQALSFHLFNCDNTFNLKDVETFLLEVKDEYGFDISVTSHYFRLSQMSELCSSNIHELSMDFAVFVVHANESRLSINEDNAGIGYSKVYRTLMKATGNKVLIVIGGDDNYRDEKEKNLAYLSRWAWRKVASQFDRTFMDGTEGFIFSWGKKHRPIHKEAFCHLLDQNKAGQKFVAQPKEERERPQDDQDTVHIQENHHQEKIHIQENYYQEESQNTKEEAEESFVMVESDPQAIAKKKDNFDSGSFDTLPELRAEDSHPSGTIFLETHLRYGKISYEAEDVKHWDHKWYPPEIIERNLEREWGATPNATVRFVPDQSGFKLQIINHTSPWLRPLVYIYDLLWNLIWNRELEKDGGAP